MPADLNKSKGRGIFTNPASSPPLDRSLVMECLPKKFRTNEFLDKWARRFGDAEIEIDPRLGKALVVFQDPKKARDAWSSPRLNGDGREHIRLYWYRAAGTEFEEGEIEEWELEGIEKLKEKDYRGFPGQPHGPLATLKLGSWTKLSI